jgi:hypothetical protein
MLSFVGVHYGMEREVRTHIFLPATYLFLGILLCAAALAQPASSQLQSPQDDPGHSFVGPFKFAPSAASDDKGATKSSLAIPPGTILPVRLNSTISSAKCSPGQVVTGRIMQDVPLPPGAKIPEGSKVIGHIVEVVPAANGVRARVSLQFDKLLSSHQTISITTNLRAIASFMAVLEAQTPPIGPSESDVYRWLTTVQVGGDVVYGEGGVVTTGEDPEQIVGKAVNGGVLSQLRAKQGTKCRGAVDGNNGLQALWVFSSDACGVYSLEHVSIAHAGRTDPTGVIVLTSDSGNFKVPGGAGMLLRVTASPIRVN